MDRYWRLADMKKVFILCIVASLLGGLIGYFVPVVIPVEYSKLFSVAILAGIESVVKGVRMLIKKDFKSHLFIYGFFINIFVAIIFVFIGDCLGLDLYYVVLLALGFKLLQDLDIVKLYVLNK